MSYLNLEELSLDGCVVSELAGVDRHVLLYRQILSRIEAIRVHRKVFSDRISDDVVQKEIVELKWMLDQLDNNPLITNLFVDKGSRKEHMERLFGSALESNEDRKSVV